MTRSAWFTLPLGLVALAAALPSQEDPTRARLEKVLTEHAAGLGVETVAAEVRVGDEALVAWGSDRRTTPGTRFPAAGLAHPWLATAVLRRVEAEELELETRVAPLLPGLLPEDCGVRVVELLRHTSGLADFRDHASPAMLARGASYAELMGTLAEVPPVNAPGECVAECATDTLLLAALVEVLYEAPADEALERAVFAPLEMESTGYALAVTLREAAADGELEAAFQPRGLSSTVADLVRYSRGMADRSLLDSETTEIFTHPAHLADGTVEPSAMGMRLVSLGEDEGHVLGDDNTAVAHFPAHDLVIAVAGSGEEPAMDDLAWNLARAVIEAPEAEPLDLPLTEEAMRPYLGSYQIGCNTVVIAAEGARLVLDELDEGRTVMLHQGDHTFLAADGSDTRIEFEVPNGEAQSFTLIRRGLRSIARRLGQDR
jgi:CubicO group peptidase (beta-lactamase class C family)